MAEYCAERMNAEEDDRFLEQLRAHAREQGGVLAMFEHFDLPDGEQLEPLVLESDPQQEGLTMLCLKDPATGQDRIRFLVFEEDLASLDTDVN